MKDGNRHINVYMRWPFVIAVIAAAGFGAVCGLAFVSRAASVAAAAATAGALILASALCYAAYRRGIKRDLVSFASDYAQVQKRLLREMHIPYALADADGVLLWRNECFAETVPASAVGRPLSAVFAELEPKAFPRGEAPVWLRLSQGEMTMRAEIRRVYVSGVLKDILPDKSGSTLAMYAIYLTDETELISLQRRYAQEKPVVALIYLDNYDEVFAGIEEVRRSLLLALIDRKINKYIGSMGGVVRKLEKDKYIAFINRGNLTTMQEQKFSLLEDVKTVNIGNDLAATISIGLGFGAEDYRADYDLARTAIDMALARGGDQAVMKENDTITYFGGKTRSIEKNTRVKARVKAQALRELIEGSSRVVIMGHQISDVDCIGAAVGVYRAARYSGKRAYIVLNTVSSSIQLLVERFAENPDYEQDLFVKGDKAKDLMDAETVLVVVDVNRPSYTECPELFGLAGSTVVIDHHRQTREVIENPTLGYVEPYASSACEMVAEILQYYGENVRLKPLDADAIYAGLVIDTNNFMNKTGIRTFEAAAFLRRNGADMVRVRKLFREDMDDYMAKAEAVRSAELFEDAFAISRCGENTGLENPTIIAAQAANDLLSIRGVKASFVLSKLGNKVYISARSIDEVNVQVIMEKLGGGGHMTIAGAQVEGATVDEVTERLKEILRRMRENREL